MALSVWRVILIAYTAGGHQQCKCVANLRCTSGLLTVCALLFTVYREALWAGVSVTERDMTVELLHVMFTHQLLTPGA